MEPGVYQQIYEVELFHWWFCVRREIIAQVMAKHVSPGLLRALDIGCGTGLNGQILQKFAISVSGLDPADEAVKYFALRSPGLSVIQGSFPEDIPLGNFDLISMFDVLEHLEDDKKSIRQVEFMLSPGGYAVITVPAYKYLWTDHDRILHHYRRYTKKSLLGLIAKETKLEPVYVSYFNTVLFLPIAVFRFLRKMLRFFPDRTDDFAVPKILNNLLRQIFSTEKFLIKHSPLPFGVSIICILKKSNEKP